MKPKTKRHSAEKKSKETPATPERATSTGPEPYSNTIEENAQDDVSQSKADTADDIIAPDGSPVPKKDPPPLL